jgi:methylated-DNA-[protein]-cysteine S-methyltransferase
MVAAAAIFYRAALASPLGEIELACDEAGALIVVKFADKDRLAALCGLTPAAAATRLVPDPNGKHTAVARTQLAAYFAGQRRTFDLVCAPRVGTPFQRRVWCALGRIPHGATWSYQELAAAVGSVARAVGGANGANPISIVWPCHRVIGADGTLTGYAGGLERKRWLLQHEGALLA